MLKSSHDACRNVVQGMLNRCRFAGRDSGDRLCGMPDFHWSCNVLVGKLFQACKMTTMKVHETIVMENKKMFLIFSHALAVAVGNDKTKIENESVALRSSDMSS